jgi:hypothetical protein
MSEGARRARPFVRLHRSHLGKDGNWYFLEINEMGQFLWIENLCPQERYLEAFIQFLFGLCRASAIPSGIELADVLASAEYRNILQGILTLPAPEIDAPAPAMHAGQPRHLPMEADLV